jgi:hypothetical protein
MKRAVINLMAILLLSACTLPTPEMATTVVKETVVVTQQPLPTYTPYPTYTPLPTYTPQAPWPTYTLPPTPTVTPVPADTPTPPWTATAEPTATPMASPSAAPGTDTPQPPAPTATPAPAITDWRGEYYANTDLSGRPAVVRNDLAVDFNWGDSVPAAGMPGDGFTARWTRNVEFEAATYRFHVLVDDGVRLWVDGNLLINAWQDSSLHEVTAEYAVVRGTHNVEVEYLEYIGHAQIRLWWEKVESPSYPDWQAEYWSNRALSGAPALVRNEKSVDYYWGISAPAPGLPEDNFSARWSRKATFQAGRYDFSAWADDGILIYVDGDPVLGEWHDSSGDEEYVFSLNLSDRHDLVVEFYEHTGQALIRVTWKKMSSLPVP